MMQRPINVDAQIATAIIDNYDNDGDFELEDCEIADGLFAYVSGNIETSTYQEDDYYNGTGAIVTASVHVNISDIDVYTFNDNGDEIPVTAIFSTSNIERYCEKELLRN